MLYRCGVDPEQIDVDDGDDCLIQLTKFMEIDTESQVEFLASGVSGAAVSIIASVFDPFKGSTKIAVKYGINLTKDINEGCIVNRYVDSSPLFVRIYGFTKCHTMPVSWLPPPEKLRKMQLSATRTYIQHLVKHGGKSPPPDLWRYPTSLTFIFMEYAGITVRRLRNVASTFTFTLNDLRCMAYDFLYGIMMARRISGNFTHGDMHTGNLTLSRVAIDKPRYYTLPETGKTFVLQSPFQLHLIDFGNSTVGGTKPTETTDISMFFWDPAHELASYLAEKEENGRVEWDEFSARMRLRANNMHDSNAVAPIEKVLANDPFLAPLRKKSKGKRRKVKCTVCFMDAPFKCSICSNYICKQCWIQTTHKNTH